MENSADFVFILGYTFFKEMTSFTLPIAFLLSLTCTMIEKSGGWARVTALMRVCLKYRENSILNRILLNWPSYGVPLVVCVPVLCAAEGIYITELTCVLLISFLVIFCISAAVIVIFYESRHPDGRTAWDKGQIRRFLWEAFPVLVLIAILIVETLRSRIWGVRSLSIAWECALYAFVLSIVWILIQKNSIWEALSAALVNIAVIGCVFGFAGILRLIYNYTGLLEWGRYMYWSLPAGVMAVVIFLFVSVCGSWVGMVPALLFSWYFISASGNLILVAVICFYGLLLGKLWSLYKKEITCLRNKGTGTRPLNNE